MPGSDLHDCINHIYNDKSGTLWVGNLSGLHKITLVPGKANQTSGVNITPFQHDPGNPNSLSDNTVYSIFEDHSGLLWIATANGLNSFDKRTNVFKRYYHDPKNSNSISSNFLRTAFGNTFAEDKEGNLWIASDSGLNRLSRDRTTFTAYRNSATDAYSISADVLTSVYIDSSDILWVGSWQGKLNKANLNQKSFGLIQS